MSERSCDEYAAGIKRAAGWVFGHLFNYYFGDGTIVLVGEGTDGTDVELAITSAWLDANHCNNFGMDRGASSEFIAHNEKCQSLQCIQAGERLRAIGPFFGEGKLPGGAAVAIVSVLEGKSRNCRTVLRRENGFGNSIDEIKPFMEWFIGDMEFWLWPD